MKWLSSVLFASCLLLQGSESLPVAKVNSDLRTANTTLLELASDWEHCANENERCNCIGSVRYGKNKRWSRAKESDGSIDCNNKIFGDPVRGTRKECQCKVSEEQEESDQQQESVVDTLANIPPTIQMDPLQVLTVHSKSITIHGTRFSLSSAIQLQTARSSSAVDLTDEAMLKQHIPVPGKITAVNPEGSLMTVTFPNPLGNLYIGRTIEAVVTNEGNNESGAPVVVSAPVSVKGTHVKVPVKLDVHVHVISCDMYCENPSKYAQMPPGCVC